MNCSNCNAEVPDGATQCPACGSISIGQESAEQQRLEVRRTVECLSTAGKWKEALFQTKGLAKLEPEEDVHRLRRSLWSRWSQALEDRATGLGTEERWDEGLSVLKELRQVLDNAMADGGDQSMGKEFWEEQRKGEEGYRRYLETFLSGKMNRLEKQLSTLRNAGRWRKALAAADDLVSLVY